jgi:N6-adenosine-specific RNA methylase IME4
MGRVILPYGQYSTILLDPPWRYKDKKTRGAAENHYPTMSDREIIRMDIESLATDNAHIYCWVTDSHLPVALKALDMWGFEYKNNMVWVKVKNGSLQIGMGHYSRKCKEMVLFGTRGRCPALAHDVPDVFWAPREEHSAKPEVLQDMIERMSPGPYLEMFARRNRPGWFCWGNDSQLTINKPQSDQERLDELADAMAEFDDGDPTVDSYGVISNA